MSCRREYPRRQLLLFSGRRTAGNGSFGHIFHTYKKKGPAGRLTRGKDPARHGRSPERIWKMDKETKSIEQIFEGSRTCREFRKNVREYGYHEFIAAIEADPVTVRLPTGTTRIGVYTEHGAVDIRLEKEDRYGHREYGHMAEKMLRDEKEVLSHIYSLYGSIRKTKEKAFPAKRKMYRYMSAAEYKKLMAGETLVWGTEHSRKTRDANSTTHGFAFLKEKNLLERAKSYANAAYPPYQCYMFLEGVVSSDYLVEFIPSPETGSHFTKAYGVYADPADESSDLFNVSTVRMSELDLTQYSRETMVPVRVVRGVPSDWRKIEEKWEEIDPRDPEVGLPEEKLEEISEKLFSQGGLVYADDRTAVVFDTGANIDAELGMLGYSRKDCEVIVVSEKEDGTFAVTGKKGEPQPAQTLTEAADIAEKIVADRLGGLDLDDIDALRDMRGGIMEWAERTSPSRDKDMTAPDGPDNR